MPSESLGPRIPVDLVASGYIMFYESSLNILLSQMSYVSGLPFWLRCSLFLHPPGFWWLSVALWGMLFWFSHPHYYGEWQNFPSVLPYRGQPLLKYSGVLVLRSRTHSLLLWYCQLVCVFHTYITDSFKHVLFSEPVDPFSHILSHRSSAISASLNVSHCLFQVSKSHLRSILKSSPKARAKMLIPEAQELIGIHVPNWKLSLIHNYILVPYGSVPLYSLLSIVSNSFWYILYMLYYLGLTVPSVKGEIPLLFSHAELFPICVMLGFDKIICLIARRVVEERSWIGQDCLERHLPHLCHQRRVTLVL